MKGFKVNNPTRNIRTDLNKIKSQIGSTDEQFVIRTLKGIYIPGQKEGPFTSAGINTFVVNVVSMGNTTNTYIISKELIAGNSFVYKAVISCVPFPGNSLFSTGNIIMFDVYSALHCNSNTLQGDSTDDGFHDFNVVRTIGTNSILSIIVGRNAFRESTLSIQNDSSSDYDIRIEFTVFQGREKIAY